MLSCTGFPRNTRRDNHKRRIRDEGHARMRHLGRNTCWWYIKTRGTWGWGHLYTRHVRDNKIRGMPSEPLSQQKPRSRIQFQQNGQRLILSITAAPPGLNTMPNFTVSGGLCEPALYVLTTVLNAHYTISFSEYSITLHHLPSISNRMAATIPSIAMFM